MPRELKGWSRSRPLRIAFFVEDGEYAHLALDGIFADSYRRWGGRFSLIVPCLSRRVTPSYWPWLEAYDPDIVYSYVELDRDAILELHERLAIGQYLFHSLDPSPRLDTQGFKPDYRFNPLASLSVVFSLARGRTGPIKVIDSWHTEQSSRLLDDNLGTYRQSFSTGMYPPDAAQAASLLTIVSPEKRNNRQYGVPQDLDAVDSELDAFAAFGAHRATSFSIVSAMMAPRLDVGMSIWSTTFNLVVGDSFADRVLFWNGRLHIPSWLDTDLCCFRVSLEHVQNPAFLSTLGEILKRRNHVNSGSGGSSNITIRSVSHGTDQLDEVEKLIASTKHWGGTSTHRVESLDELAPSQQNLQHAREVYHFGSVPFMFREWTEFTWTRPMARVTPPAPRHLDDAPVRQRFAMGYWYTDMIFEYEAQGPRSAEGNRWTLPKRWHLEGAFGVARTGDAQHAIPPVVRRSKGGNLAVPMAIEHPIATITVPTPEKAMQHALAIVGRSGHTHPDTVAPPQRVTWTEPSNEARHLVGVLGMTGGLQQATSLLLHPFLEATFAKLGGTTRLSSADVAPTVNRLQKQMKRRSDFDLTRDDDRNALADLVVKAARGLGRPREFIPYDELQKSWKSYRETYWARRPRQDHGDSRDDWDALEARTLDECLVSMRRKRMLFQGHAWTCRRCHHKNWIDLGSLKPELLCEVCSQETDAPVDLRWLFRPNEFLIESLRGHSVLSLVWTLAALCQRSRQSFIFVEPTWFGFTNQAKKPDAEADLMVLLDGKAVLCEVKASWGSLRVVDIEGFVVLAKRLRPDIALLAVMETGQQRQEALAKARSELVGVGIEFELLTPDRFNVDDAPYLGTADDDE